MKHTIEDPEKIKSLANSLELIDPPKDKPGRIWYSGEGYYYFDLMIDVDENQEILWFEVTWEGNDLRWSRKNADIKLGKTSEFKTGNSYYPASTIIDEYLRPEADLCFVELVKKIFQCRADEPLFAELLKLLG